MAIKINLESTKIPVEIGNLKFEIDVEDRKHDTFIRTFNSFLTDINQLDENNVDDSLKLKKMITEVYEELLGIGSFDKVYNKVPNISIVAGILMQVVEELSKIINQKILPKNEFKLMSKND